MSMAGDLASQLAVTLRPVLDQHHLVVVSVDAFEALLIGRQYALHFTADRDGLDASYIERNEHGQLDAFTLRPLVMQRFTPVDRAHYGSPTTVDERIAASVRVYASGLGNRCQDVLGGEKSWLQRTAWRASKPNALVERALRSAGFV